MLEIINRVVKLSGPINVASAIRRQMCRPSVIMMAAMAARMQMKYEGTIGLSL